MALDAEVRSVIEELVNVLNHVNVSTGYCCCGSKVDDHGFGDGHSPVDEGEYYAGMAVDRAMKLLGATNANTN